VARGERSGAGSRLLARAESAVVTLPRSRPGDRAELRRLAPSGRSLLVGLALVGLAAALWTAARTTSLFAVDTIAVGGAPASVAQEVRVAVRDVEGRSLVSLDMAQLRTRLEAVPTVASVRLDRAFPHTLAIAVVPERPVAVLRQGAESWLVSARGRVLRRLPRGGHPALPRVWLGRGTSVQLGATLHGDPAAAVRAVAPLVDTALPVRVASVKATVDELTLVLRSGFEVRLGDGSQLPLKLAVARRILPSLGAGAGYLDVAVPGRPVASDSLNSHVEVESQLSISP
jgi:cell division protein FtsQ